MAAGGAIRGAVVSEPKFVETMTSISWGQWDIRVWRNRSLLPDDISKAHVELQGALHLLGTLPEVHSALRQDATVTAYEILDYARNGELLHMGWP